MRIIARTFYLLLVLPLLVLVVLVATWQLRWTLLCLLFTISAIFFPFPAGIKQLVKRYAKWAALLSLIVVAILFPGRNSSNDNAFQSVFINPSGANIPQPWPVYLLNLLPEADIVKLTLWSNAIFPFPAQGVILEELRDQEVSADNIFIKEYALLHGRANTGQVTPLQLLKTLGYYKAVSHFYWHVSPEAKAVDKPLPVVIFLHGFMGNFQFYNSYFSELGECVLICPSDNDLLGYWSAGELDQILGTYLDVVAQQVPIDRNQIHLIGLSNGGSGVNQALESHARKFQSVTFLSTGIQVVPSPGIPPTVGVIWGTHDSMKENNPIMVQRMKNAGVNVKSYPYERERHFLMLTRRDEVLNNLRSLLGLPTLPQNSKR